jgi:hypothetical protein
MLQNIETQANELFLRNNRWNWKTQHEDHLTSAVCYNIETWSYPLLTTINYFKFEVLFLMVNF